MHRTYLTFQLFLKLDMLFLLAFSIVTCVSGKVTIPDALYYYNMVIMISFTPLEVIAIISVSSVYDTIYAFNVSSDHVIDSLIIRHEGNGKLECIFSLFFGHVS